MSISFCICCCTRNGATRSLLISREAESSKITTESHFILGFYGILSWKYPKSAMPGHSGMCSSGGHELWRGEQSVLGNVLETHNPRGLWFLAVLCYDFRVSQRRVAKLSPTLIFEITLPYRSHHLWNLLGFCCNNSTNWSLLSPGNLSNQTWSILSHCRLATFQERDSYPHFMVQEAQKGKACPSPQTHEETEPRGKLGLLNLLLAFFPA